MTDEDTSNDTATSSHTEVSGSVVTLTIDTDCWGAETSWQLADNGGIIVDFITAGSATSDVPQSRPVTGREPHPWSGGFIIGLTTINGWIENVYFDFCERTLPDILTFVQNRPRKEAALHSYTKTELMTVGKATRCCTC